MIEEISLADIRTAAERIAPFIHRTPVLTCSGIDELAGAQLFLKAENFQRTGSFKCRGANNAVRSLSADACAQGVATHSSGNHGAALARAAQCREIPAYIVMPENAPAVKQAAVKGYGAEITLCSPQVADREASLSRLIEKTGAVFIPSYDDPRIIGGQGTAVLELLDEVPDLDTIVVPVGGGGLASGTVIAAHGVKEGIAVIGVEPELADDAFCSLREGRLLPQRPPVTVADGLRMPLSERTFRILRQGLERIVLVSEMDILAAMRLLWERAKIVVEPSAAAALAGLMNERDVLAGQRVGVVISGGNVDVDREKLAS